MLGRLAVGLARAADDVCLVAMPSMLTTFGVTPSVQCC